MRDKLFFFKKRKKPEGAAQPQTISQIPEKGKCWVVFCFLVFSFFFCQDTEKINKALLQSISSSPHFTPPAQLFLFLRGEACIVTVVGDLFLLFVVCLLFFFFAAVEHHHPQELCPQPVQEQDPAATSLSHPTPLQRRATRDAAQLPPASRRPQPPSVPGGCDPWS